MFCSKEMKLMMKLLNRYFAFWCIATAVVYGSGRVCRVCGAVPSVCNTPRPACCGERLCTGKVAILRIGGRDRT